MRNSATKIRIFFGTCYGIDYVISRTRDEAAATIKSHYAYGNPSSSPYAISEQWANVDSDDGWKIREEEVYAEYIKVTLLIDPKFETSHITWGCTCCGKSFSDEWNKKDDLPALLMCSCQGVRKIYLGLEQKHWLRKSDFMSDIFEE